MKSNSRDKLLNPYSLIIIILFWVITSFLFYQKELKTYFTSTTNKGYKAVIPEDLLIEDVWKNIYFHNEKIGYSHTYFRLLEEKKEGEYLIKNTSIIYLPFGSKSNKLYFHSKAKLCSKKQLKNFKIDINSSKFTTEIEGKKIGANKLKIIQKKDSRKNISLIEVPENLILSSFLQPTSRFKNKNLEKDFSFNVFNPFLMKKQTVKVEYQRTKNTNKRKIYILECKYQNYNYTIWVNEKGQIIKEISPIGIKVIRVKSSEAIKNLRKIQKVSLRKKFSIPVKINYSNLEDLTMLKVKLKNLDLKSLNLEFKNQIIIEKKQHSVILKIRKGEIEKGKKEYSKAEELQKFLKATPYIQKNNPKIKKIAQRISPNSSTATTKIKRFLWWIGNNINQLPTFSVPSAIEVLENKVGDCNEITYLFTALTRAINIPTKLVTGLVYLNNRFQYHMWVEVYINNHWISVDPTLTQFPCDVTHIGLIEGGYENQIKLSNIIPKIKIEILNKKAR